MAGRLGPCRNSRIEVMKEFPAITQIQGDAIIFGIRSRVACGSKMAPLRSPLGQPAETEYLAIASKHVVDAIVCIFNPGSASQAGRRGLESRLPLHLFNHLHASPNQLLSHLSQLDCRALKSDQSADTASCFRAIDESTYFER